MSPKLMKKIVKRGIDFAKRANKRKDKAAARFSNSILLFGLLVISFCKS